MDSEFPPNSARSKVEAETPEEKKVESVVSGAVQRRKKPLGKRFQDTFFNGDARGTAGFVVASVLIPAAKDMLVETGQQFIERMVYGETRPPASMSRRARARHDFDEIVLESRGEAEEVLDRMFDLLSRYDSVSVADLYELTGIQSAHTDQKWGWPDLRGSQVTRTRTGGYVIDLPEPSPLG
jgi:hypothetical protein